MPRGLERLHPRLRPLPVRIETGPAASGQREQTELASFHLKEGRRAADRETLQALQPALSLSPYLAKAHLLTGRLHLRAGRTAKAVQALTIAAWSEESVATLVARAEARFEAGEVTAARVAVERALALDARAPAVMALKARLPSSS